MTTITKEQSTCAFNKLDHFVSSVERNWYDGEIKAVSDLRAYIAQLEGIVKVLVEALEDADRFITNGIEHGFITMPDAGAPATETPGIIKAAIACGKVGA